MKKTNIRKILLDDGYSSDMIKSIMSGRRKPNADKRYEYEKKHSIPFTAWNDFKSFLLDNNTIKNSNTSRLHT